MCKHSLSLSLRAPRACFQLFLESISSKEFNFHGGAFLAELVRSKRVIDGSFFLFFFFFSLEKSCVKGVERRKKVGTLTVSFFLSV